ncbi:MAG: hypothetical protein QNJ07_10365 [Woeseiaceae bacterium]|nr:hypothetical protein [Woeseiaceae bacterium]
MPDSKNLKWADNYGTDAEVEESAADATMSNSGPAANDADGWQQYRHWISKAPAPKSRRSGIDPSLYTWKGYRNWTDQVRRNWTQDPADDGNSDD